MAWVMLKKDAQTSFRRLLRDKEGKPLTDETGKPTDAALVFQPGVPLEIPRGFLHVVKDDILKRTLIPVDDYEGGHPKVIELSDEQLRKGLELELEEDGCPQLLVENVSVPEISPESPDAGDADQAGQSVPSETPPEVAAEAVPVEVAEQPAGDAMPGEVAPPVTGKKKK